jgi:hypothetical protein
MRPKRHARGMRGKIFVVVSLITPACLWAETTRRVEIAAIVPLVAHVDCPAELELAPGEVRRVTLRVACNQPWLLAVQTDNPHVRVSGQQRGHAGGMAAAGNTFAVTLTCAPSAHGPQRTRLATRLSSNPFATGISP